MNISFPTDPTAPITQTYDNYRPDLYGGDGKHKGVDLGVPANTPVYACLDGVIELAEIDRGYGRNIRVRHADGAASIYAHLNKVLITIGQQVTAGQTIGLSGGDPNDNIPNDGNSTGAHLHFEVRNAANKPINPFEYLLAYLPAGQAARCVASGGLNVRSAPNTDAQVLYTLKYGETIQVLDQASGWARVRDVRAAFCVVDWIETEISGMTIDQMVAKLWAAHPDLH